MDVRCWDREQCIATGYGLDVRTRDSAITKATGYGMDVRNCDSDWPRVGRKEPR
jgi:hypothetical protein